MVRIRSSALTRTSCDPLIRRLPFGMTSVTTAATDNSMFSERVVSPAPFVVVLELMSPPADIWAVAPFQSPLSPRSSERPAVRLRSDSFLNLARSLISIFTVRISPFESARGSVKRRLCRSLHKEKRRGGAALVSGYS
jgi:hypothetical protein